MRKLFEKLRRVTGIVIEAVQKVVLTVSLFFVYFVGIGLTWLLALVFDRGMLRGTRAGQDSYWIEAEGYDPDREQALRQT